MIRNLVDGRRPSAISLLEKVDHQRDSILREGQPDRLRGRDDDTGEGPARSRRSTSCSDWLCGIY
jgi:hypothetical protein